MKVPWKLIILGVAALLIISAIAYGGTGYKMIREWINADQMEIQQDLEREVTRLDEERSQYIKQIAQLKQEKSLLNQQYKVLEGRYINLETQFANIIVPGTPDELVLAFRKRGFNSAIRTLDGRICFTTK
jgi:predicted nuclease with TOPRIM domain